MPQSVQSHIDTIRRMPHPAARQRAYAALARRLEHQRSTASLLQAKYALGLWVRHLTQLAAEERHAEETLP